MSTRRARVDSRPPDRKPALDLRAKAAFWGVVEDCLVRFHGIPEPSARSKADALRKKVEDPPPGIYGDIIYHDEPFYVACDLADVQNHRKRDSLFRKHMVEYRVIARSRGW